MLYIVSTPIGNLEDISPRAIDTLKNVHTILAEDTRHTIKLLNHYDIKTPQISYHQHTSAGKTDFILSLLREHDVALVSDAGTPGISDPGSQLINLAVDAGIAVSPIPGPCAAISALICSGYSSERFVFLGFLPQKKTAQQNLVKASQRPQTTLIFYESTHRIYSTLLHLEPVLGKKEITIGREITKKFEEFIRGPYTQVRQKLETRKLKGELVVIVSP